MALCGRWLFRAGLGAWLLAGAGCRQEMWQQPRDNPLDMNRFFKDTMSARPLEPGTVPQSYLRTNQAFYEGLVGTNLVTELPVPVTKELLSRGQQRYNIYCIVCHGGTGAADGMIVQRGFPPPPSYHIQRLREAPVGHFYRVISLGYGVMYPYAVRVQAPEDRWAIAAYIRALQLSQQGTLQQVPPETRTKLQEGRP